MTKIFKNSNLKPAFAFTLAEVLITLVIIGVIAAATIPTLLQKHLEAEMVAKLKKNFSVLNNALSQAIRENGAVDEWDIGTYETSAGATKFYQYIKPYLKVQKECGTTGTSTECFAPQSEYKALFNNTFGNSLHNRARYLFLLEDGTAVSIISKGTGCEDPADGTKKYYNKRCGTIFVDLNGTKGPNRSGVDLFCLAVTEKNVTPCGIGAPGLRDSDNLAMCVYGYKNSAYNGSYCAMHVIYKGNMDYLHKSIAKDWENYP